MTLRLGGIQLCLRRLTGVAWIALAFSACAGVKARPADAPDGSRARIISAETVERSGARSMWDAIKLNVKHAWFTESAKGDPERIRTRGASTVSLFEDMRIFVDGALITDLNVLSETPARHIGQIKVLSGIDATTYYGTMSGDGVILITTRQGG
ncbi:MAG: TonB-dependent receptor plug domain-containing protein [Longimicrobiales bacterium]